VSQEQAHRRIVLPPSTVSSRHRPVGNRIRGIRARRSADLIDAVHRLDVAVDQATRDSVAAHIRAEYERDVGEVPLGFVAPCALGPPYVDHILDLGQTIVEHYGPADAMPEPFAQARMLVRSGAYAYVEVYLSGTVVPVLADGTAVV
jgi:hypothetical protein